MKKTRRFGVLILTTIVIFSCKTGSDKKINGDAGIAFTDTLIEFGQMEFSSDGDREFVFANTGKVPLLVTHVKSTCGCTIPAWSEEPVMPGDSGSIKVSYDTHRVGRFKKSVYVYSNAIEGTRRLLISGEVLRQETSNLQNQ